MVAEHCLLRKPLQRASDDALEIPHLGGTIQIHHPGYPKGETLLLALSGYDDLEGSISFDVALTACAILACNRFDGWISRESTADAPKLIGISLLSPGDYWFHVLAPDDQLQQTYRYPIVPNFRSWSFPQDVPPSWRMPAADIVPTLEEIQACHLTRQSLAVDQAHIIPGSEEQWFMANQMGATSRAIPVLQVPVARSAIDRDSNLLSLRTDIHRLWDQKHLTFVPKKDQDGHSRLVVHCLTNKLELQQLYHNRPLVEVHNKPWEFFLARFAWTLFPTAVDDFLGRRKPRVLQILQEDGQVVEREFSADDCDHLRNAPLPRSTSPKKRKAGYNTDTHQDRGCDDGNDESTSLSPKLRGRPSRSFDSGLGSSQDYVFEDGYDYEYELEMSTRGRKRRRS